MDDLIYVEYGLYEQYAAGRPHHKVVLTPEQAKELWDRCSVLVGLGDMHWFNRAPTPDEIDSLLVR